MAQRLIDRAPGLAILVPLAQLGAAHERGGTRAELLDQPQDVVTLDHRPFPFTSPATAKPSPTEQLYDAGERRGATQATAPLDNRRSRNYHGYMKRDSKLFITLHLLAHLDEAGGHSTTSEELAAHFHTNPVVIRRTLAVMREAGIVA